MDAEKDVKEFIDQIEIKFQELWEALSFFKGVRLEGLGKKAITFQSNLADCQFAIDKKFRQIRLKQKEVRNSRKEYTKSDFLQLDKQLTNCENALTNLIYLGKSLGDAFVWFFLQNDREILDEHLLHQDEFLMPSGELGGIGEVEFIRSYKMIEDNMILYHGITSILRVGDFSLVNLKTHRFTALAELKTDKREGNKITARLITFGLKEKVNPIFSKYYKDQDRTVEVNDNQKTKRDQRLDKQIETMVSTIEKSSTKPNKKDSLYAKSYLEELETLLEKKDQSMSYLKASDGMLFVLIRSQKSKLSERLFDQNSFDISNMDELERQVLSLMDKDTDRNGMLFGSIHYNRKRGINLTQGTKPFFWSELPMEHIKKIYFGEVAVLTVYNPLHLWRLLEERGFRLEYVERYNKKCLIIDRPLGSLIISSLGYFFNLITCHLMDEKTVLKMIEETIESTKDIKEPTEVLTQFRIV